MENVFNLSPLNFRLSLKTKELFSSWFYKNAQLMYPLPLTFAQLRLLYDRIVCNTSLYLASIQWAQQHCRHSIFSSPRSGFCFPTWKLSMPCFKGVKFFTVIFFVFIKIAWQFFFLYTIWKASFRRPNKHSSNCKICLNNSSSTSNDSTVNLYIYYLRSSFSIIILEFECFSMLALGFFIV